MNLLMIFKSIELYLKRLHIISNIWPIIVCILGWISIAQRLDKPIEFDPQYVYLPAARALIEQGWSFFLTPDSYRVAPLGYLWPALWGGDPQLIRIANAGLWAGCVYFLWHTCCMLGSRRAGIAGVLLLAAQPEIYRYFSTEMTEPIFLFGIFGWLYATAKIIIKNRTGIKISIQSGFFLSLTLLSRPVLQFIAPLALLFCITWLIHEHWFHKKSNAIAHQPLIITLAFGFIFAMLLPILWAIKNGIAFGLWGLGTGAGTGLYLGTHPLFLGTEPSFLGFTYDVNGLTSIAAGTGDHLSLTGDRVARAAAIWQIQSMSPTEFFTFFVRKLWWWLMDQPLGGQNLRKFRIFEWIFIAAGCIVFLRTRKKSISLLPQTPPESSLQPISLPDRRMAFIGFLIILLALMIAQLLPVLYNSRYNSALLEPWLIPLTAFSISLLSAPLVLQAKFHQNSWNINLSNRTKNPIAPNLIKIITIIFIIPLAYNSIRILDHIQINPDNMGAVISIFKIDSTERIRTQNMQAGPNHTWISTASPSVLLIDISRNDLNAVEKIEPFNAIWKTKISITSQKNKKCKYVETAYQTASGEILQPRDNSPLKFSIKSDGTEEFVVTHANGLLRPNTPGSLRLVFHCPVGTQVRWKETEFLESRQPWAAASLKIS